MMTYHSKNKSSNGMFLTDLAKIHGYEALRHRSRNLSLPKRYVSGKRWFSHQEILRLITTHGNIKITEYNPVKITIVETFKKGFPLNIIYKIFPFCSYEYIRKCISEYRNTGFITVESKMNKAA